MFVELLGISATVLAALAAVGAVVQAGRQGRKALRSVARERRLDFELGVLKDLADNVIATKTRGDAGPQRLEDGREVREHLLDEVRAAITLRLHERASG